MRSAAGVSRTALVLFLLGLLTAACGSAPGPNPGGSGTAPTISTQPASQTVVAGSAATFTVVASGTAPLSYQWRRNGSSLAGATGAWYATPATTVADSGSTFDVVVSNGAGSVASAPATLTVRDSGPYPTDVPYAPLDPMPMMAMPPAAHATAGAVDNASTFTGFADPMRVVTINSTSVHHYMKDNPWSADGKFLKLHSGGAILDATTLQPLGAVSQCSNSSRQWSMVTPNVVWSTSQAGYLCKTTVAADGSGGTLDSTFQRLPAGIGYVLGGFQGAIDDGDHYAPLLAGDEPSLLPLVIWDIQSATTKCTISAGHTGIYNAGMSHDGAYVTLMGTGSAGAGLFTYRISDCTRTAGPFGALDTEGRYDACVNQAGEQVTVWTGGTGSNQTNTIYMTRLSDGLTTPVLHDPQGPLAGYISCRNSKRPGWAYFSPQLTTANANVIGAAAWQRIMAIKLEDTANSSNGNGTVENFAWAHLFPLCNGGAAIGNLFCYGGEPAGVPSFDGTRVLWKGYWDADATGSVATGTSVPLRAYVAWKAR